MLLPTNDKTILEEIAAYIYKCFGTWKENSYYDLSRLNQTNWQDYAKDILNIFERNGYHKGLPSIIEEALNSGDGVYRP